MCAWAEPALPVELAGFRARETQQRFDPFKADSVVLSPESHATATVGADCSGGKKHVVVVDDQSYAGLEPRVPEGYRSQGQCLAFDPHGVEIGTTPQIGNASDRRTAT